MVFDFAYLKKPVIYYQHDENYHFDVKSAYFKYDTMGFGPVIKTIEDLRWQVKKLVENDCEMDEEYTGRVDDFFKYNDRNNCQRIIDAILDVNDYY